ncbi:hypothetical protein [Roseospira goensis]|uniref:Fibronectin type-III domain-containing protein n=1 Tax=Roseospira goensis TaxID=391922 RepID=A0A7W6RWK7_9PROT|nr:hypothetical protein [Roseospira goensis]MBB4284584.1 hypothetical protein [Roseospira goensis]
MAATDQDQTDPNDPKITSAIYDGASVRAAWTPSQDTGVTGYVILLAYLGGGDTVITHESDPIPGRTTNRGTLTLPEPLNTDVAYQVVVRALWDDTPGQASAPVILPTARPALVSALYDGSDIHATWAPSWQAAVGYEIVVFSTDSGLTYSTPVAGMDTTAGVITAAQMGGGLDAAQQWVITVAAVGEGNASARADLAAFPKPLACPTLEASSLYRQGTAIVARWSAPPAQGVDSVRLSAIGVNSGTEHAITLAASATNGTLALPAPLPETEPVLLRVAAVGAAGAGVSAPGTPLIATLPSIKGATYDGQTMALTWHMAANAAVSGFTLQVFSQTTGQAMTASVSGGTATHGTIPLGGPLADDQTWLAQVIATGEGIGAEGILVPVVTGTAAVTSVTSAPDNTTLDVCWTAPGSTVPPEYTRLTLHADGTPVAAVRAAGLSATLPVPAAVQGVADGAPPALTVALAPGAGAALNTAAPPVAAVAAAPSVTGFAVDALTGTATLRWAGLDGVSGYRIDLPGGARLYADDTTAPLPAGILAAGGAPPRVTVRAAVSEDGRAVLGPVSAPFTLAHAPPDGVSARYDGATLTVDWDPVPAAASFTVTVLQTTDGTTTRDGDPFTAPAGATGGRWPYTPSTPSATHTVVVQANQPVETADNLGPPSAPVALFRPAFVPSAAAASVAFPHLYPAARLATALAGGTPGAPITLFVPDVGNGTPLSGLPVTAGPFSLATSSAAPAYPYALTIAVGGDGPDDPSPWSFGAEPIRADLRAAYVDFLKALESAGAAPWGILAIQDALSRTLPQTFAEVLYYGYGLTVPSADTGATLGSVDLRPGMVLRVAASPYQAISESSSALRWSNGYVAGPVVDYEVGQFIDSAGGITTGWDSFFGQLVAGGALSVNPPPSHDTTEQMGGVADAADLYFPAFVAPFYRLFAPTTLPGASDPTPTDTPTNVTLAAASSFTALTTAGNTPGGADPVAYFRGRAMPRPCLRVTLDGAPMVVPVGTTVANLLAQRGQAPFAAPGPVTGLTLTRSLGAAVLDPTAPATADQRWPVRLDWSGLGAYGPGWTALSLPLLPGDSVTTNLP